MTTIKEQFINELKRLSDEHKNEPNKYYIVVNPNGNINLDGIIFKATSKYELWLKINSYDDFLWSEFYDCYEDRFEDINEIINLEFKLRDEYDNEMDLYWVEIKKIV